MLTQVRLAQNQVLLQLLFARQSLDLLFWSMAQLRTNLITQTSANLRQLKQESDILASATYHLAANKR